MDYVQLAHLPLFTVNNLYSLEQGRVQVQEAKRLGYDGMMIYATCTSNTYSAILDEAEKIGLPISGHFPIFINQEEVLKSKQSEFDNLTGITRRGKLRLDQQNLIQHLKAYQKAITPSLAVHKSWALSHRKDSLFQSPLMDYIPNKIKAIWAPQKNLTTTPSIYPYEEVAQLIKTLSNEDIQLFLGSDGGYPLVIPGFAYLDEIELFARAGISNYKILRYATSDAAHFLQLQNIGTVEVGKKADLQILSANPLLDIKGVRAREGVMANGKWYSRNYLHRALAQLK